MEQRVLGRDGLVFLAFVLNEKKRNFKRKKQQKKKSFFGVFFSNLYTKNCITSYLYILFYSRCLFEDNSEIVYLL